MGFFICSQSGQSGRKHMRHRD